jgi:hypothetical protein
LIVSVVRCEKSLETKLLVVGAFLRVLVFFFSNSCRSCKSFCLTSVKGTEKFD